MCPTHLRLSLEKYLQKILAEEKDRLRRSSQVEVPALVEAAASAYLEEVRSRLQASSFDRFSQK